jgi:hypothetical protein
MLLFRISRSYTTLLHLTFFEQIRDQSRMRVNTN